VFLFFNDSGGGGAAQAAVWNPQTNQLNVLSSGPISAWGLPVRSGDGTRVYAANNQYGTGVEVYDAKTKTLNTVGGGTLYPAVVAVNSDGSRLVLGNGTNPMGLYDQSLSLLGTLPGSLTGFGIGFPLDGGVLFSADSSKLYEIGAYNGPNVVLTIDGSTMKVLGTAATSRTSSSFGAAVSGTPTPFAIDSSGMILAIQTYGISFEDSTFYQNYAAYQPTMSGIPGETTDAGPLTGGTVSSLYSFPPLTPDVWFGTTRGSANISQSQLEFTSPPSSTPGPVNVKFIFPDGEQGMFPQLFSYSTFPEYSVISGSSPDGGAPASIVGYGLPQDPSGGTLSVGSSTATITTTKGQYPPFSQEPYPSTILNYVFPPGTPGWADINVSTPIGSGTLPKSVFYAKSVTDYSSLDSFTAVLVDNKRQQVYLSASDHVDVFSMKTNQFGTPLQPAAHGTHKQFTGLALTTDGSQLLVADLADESLAVINPDSPSSTYAIPLPAPQPINQCAVGPLYVSATSTNLAFVTYGSLPAISCPQFGSVYIVNLQTHAVAPPSDGRCASGFAAEASGDGNFVVIGDTPCIYSVQASSYLIEVLPFNNSGNGIAVSFDGNVVGSDQKLGDLGGNVLGSIAHPIPFYGNPANGNYPPYPFPYPRLNASGSLYYLSFPNYFEVIDVQHATLRVRFSLTQEIQNTAAPLAVDSAGRFVYLLTDKGLTVVDFGAALLSIGHVSQKNASPGTQITVRGSGFDSSTAATVGGVAASVSVSDQNTLTLTIPAAAAGPQDIVLSRGDGTSYTLENGVVLP
jgi:IPT/TIG domain